MLEVPEGTGGQPGLITLPYFEGSGSWTWGSRHAWQGHLGKLCTGQRWAHLPIPNDPKTALEAPCSHPERLQTKAHGGPAPGFPASGPLQPGQNHAQENKLRGAYLQGPDAKNCQQYKTATQRVRGRAQERVSGP